MRKFIPIILMLLIGGFVGYLAFSIQNPDFKKLNPEKMYQRIIQERDFAISQAMARGDYRCCINPPCTMCYMEANQWNNNTPGTCACDDLIALGKEACPQCKRGLCEGKDSTCDIESVNVQ